MTKQQMAEKILATLEGNRFERWYKGQFEDYISGNLPPHQQNKVIVLEEIGRLFLNDPFLRGDVGE